MHPNDLKEFRDNVAIPRMMQLFEETQLPDDVCYIDNLEVELLDGRNCGVDSHICASGLVYCNGRAEEYMYDEYDVGLNSFFSAHKDCVFISDGNLRIGDELEEMELNTRIRNIQTCKKLFSWLDVSSEIKFEMSSIQYEKLKYLLENQQQVSLDSQISLAQNKSKNSFNSETSVIMRETER